MPQLKQMIGDDERFAAIEKNAPPVTLQINLARRWAMEQSGDATALLNQCDVLQAAFFPLAIYFHPVPQHASSWCLATDRNRY